MPYWQENDLASKSEFLKRLSCSEAMNYSPLRADPVIVKVLTDAIDSGVGKDIISKIVTNYNCLFAAYHSPEYGSIEKFISDNQLNNICSKERLEASYVILAASGVNLRSAPSTSGEKIGTIAEGVLIELIEMSGNWAYIRSYAGEGYVYYPLLKGLKDS